MTWPEACWPVVAATGHRPQHFNEIPAGRRFTIAKLADCARWLRDEAGTTVALSGMALGVDLWWADAATRAGLILGAHVPCPPNPKWPPAQLAEYRRLLDLADPAYSRTYAETYTGTCMDDRNRGMIAAADALVCVWMSTKPRGGTVNAIRDAHRMGRVAGLHIDPTRWAEPKRAVRFGIPSPRRQDGPLDVLPGNG